MNPETLKQFCPLQIIKDIGSEAIWMYQKAQQVKEQMAKVTYEVQV